MQFKKHFLKNGMRVVLAPMPGNSATTVLTLVEAGSKYEAKNISGLSHFLEHLVFKGTEKRPKSLDISKELDGIGADYNAFTSQEWTGYYAKVRNQDAEKALDIISDIYIHPAFDAGEMEKEKGVVIEELNMYEDMPQRKVADLFMELLYGDQPAGWDVGGNKEAIKKLTREDILKYRGEHYLASATSVIIAGDLDANGGEAGLIKKIENYFSKMPSGEKMGKEKVSEKQSEPAVLVKHKDSDQTHIILGCRAFDVFDPRRYALEIMGDVLGGGMSSRLFQRVREELGAAYYVRTDVDLFTDHGFIAASAGVEHSKLETVIKAILEEMSQLRDKGITETELAHAKSHLSGRLMLGLETSDQLAMYYGGQEILGREVIEPEELLKRIKAVSVRDIKEAAEFVFQNNKLNLALIGPYKNGVTFEKILRLL